MKNVNKFDIEWQFFRVSLKGLSWEEKENKIIKFCSTKLSSDNKSRILNYIKACQVSSRNLDEKIIINNFYKKVEIKKTINYITEASFSKFSREECCNLYKDLFTRNKKWLEQGYFHSEQNRFLDELSFFVNNPRKEELMSLRDLAQKSSNRYSFIF